MFASPLFMGRAQIFCLKSSPLHRYLCCTSSSSPSQPSVKEEPRGRRNFTFSVLPGRQLSHISEKVEEPPSSEEPSTYDNDSSSKLETLFGNAHDVHRPIPELHEPRPNSFGAPGYVEDDDEDESLDAEEDAFSYGFEDEDDDQLEGEEGFSEEKLRR